MWSEFGILFKACVQIVSSRKYKDTPIDILETRSSPHKDTAIADITSKMITEMAYRDGSTFAKGFQF